MLPGSEFYCEEQETAKYCSRLARRVVRLVLIRPGHRLLLRENQLALITLVKTHPDLPGSSSDLAHLPVRSGPRRSPDVTCITSLAPFVVVPESTEGLGILYAGVWDNGFGTETRPETRSRCYPISDLTTSQLPAGHPSPQRTRHHTLRQEQAVRAFVRLGGEERQGKGSHRVVNHNGVNLSIPKGVLKVGLLRRLLRIAGVSEDEFSESL